MSAFQVVMQVVPDWPSALFGTVILLATQLFYSVYAFLRLWSERRVLTK